jgi:hypothetical protein
MSHSHLYLRLLIAIIWISLIPINHNSIEKAYPSQAGDARRLLRADPSYYMNNLKLAGKRSIFQPSLPYNISLLRYWYHRCNYMTATGTGCTIQRKEHVYESHHLTPFPTFTRTVSVICLESHYPQVEVFHENFAF